MKIIDDKGNWNREEANSASRIIKPLIKKIFDKLEKAGLNPREIYLLLNSDSLEECCWRYIENNSTQLPTQSED